METIVKTSQSEGMPLTPIGNAVPTPTTWISENGESRPIDTGAKLKDDRPYSAIFAEEFTKGNLDKFENANQINKHLRAIKGAASPCTYFVNQRSHGWNRVNGKWVRPTPEWLKANPYVAGTRARAAKPILGRLSDADLETLKAQIAGQETAFKAVDDTVKAVLLPILDGLRGKLAQHEKAVAEEALTAEKAKARTNAEAAFKRVLLACDRAGVAWQDAAYDALRNLGLAAGLDAGVLDACLWAITPETVPETA